MISNDFLPRKVSEAKRRKEMGPPDLEPVCVLKPKDLTPFGLAALVVGCGWINPR